MIVGETLLELCVYTEVCVLRPFRAIKVYICAFDCGQLAEKLLFCTSSAPQLICMESENAASVLLPPVADFKVYCFILGIVDKFTRPCLRPYASRSGVNGLLLNY